MTQGQLKVQQYKEMASGYFIKKKKKSVYREYTNKKNSKAKQDKKRKNMRPAVNQEKIMDT